MAYRMMLVYIFILFVRPQEWFRGFVGLPILDAVVGLTILAWMAERGKRRWTMRSAPQNWLMIGLFAAVLMSHVRHTYLAALVDAWINFGKILIMYFLLASLVDTPAKLRGVVRTIGAGCLFMAFHGIMQAHSIDHRGFGGAPALIDGGNVRVQAFGFFHDPNDLAMMLVALLPFILERVLDKRASSNARALNCLVAIPLLYCIYLTNSRGGWLALAVALMAFAFLRMRNKPLAVVLGSVSTCVVLVLGPSRMQSIGTEGRSVHQRLIAWAYGNQMLKRWPLFGAGKDRFTEFSDDGLVAHNSFVHCWGELGLFGYFFWLALVLASLKDAYALSGIEPRDDDAWDMKLMGRAGVASLAGFMAASFFLSRTYVHTLFLLFALFAALRHTYELNYGPLPKAFNRSDIKLVLAAEVLSIPALYVFMQVIM